MYNYKISIQFAAANAPNFEKIMPVIDRAIEYYNTKSLIAKNPKRIIEKKLLDSCTLQVLLQSEAELPYPSKALRLFSGYLVDSNTEGNLNQYISGKQLFKMQADSFFDDSNNREKTFSVQDSEDLTGPDLVKRLVQILLLNRESDKDVIKKVKDALLEWEE